MGAILHVLYAEPDKTLAGVAAFLSDPRRPIETTLRAMMATPHLGERPHTGVVGAAQEVINKKKKIENLVRITWYFFLIYMYKYT